MRERGLWTWFLLAGLVILPLLGLHMAVMHLDKTLALGNPAGGRPIDWANVVARGKTLFYTITYPILLGAALFHGFYGLRTVLFELEPARWLKRTISAVLVVAGLALFGLGLWAAVAAPSVARAAGFAMGS